MKKLNRKLRLSINGGIVESPVPLHRAFGLYEEDGDDELKCDYDIL
ncbi:hypothetical protein RYH73_11010 [Olivibacter sp. CPCC 100613]